MYCCQLGKLDALLQRNWVTILCELVGVEWEIGGKKQKYCSILIDRNLKVQDYTPTLILHTPQIKAEKYVSFTLYKICHNMSVIYKVMHTAIKCLKKYVCVGKWKKTKSRIKKDKKYKDYNYLLAFYAFGILKIWMGEKEH